MSNRLNQVILTWKDIERHVRCTAVRRMSHTLKGRDLRSAQDAILLWEMTLVDLTTPYGSPPSWNVKQHVKYVLNTDLMDLVGLLKEADKLLIQNCISGEPDSYDGFKRHLSSERIRAGNILFPLRGLIELWHDETSTDTFRRLHTSFVFLSRLSLRDVPDLRQKAMEDYLRIEQSLESVLPTDEEGLIISRWFPRVHDVRFSILYQDAEFQHGPGAVADLKRPNLALKYKKLGEDGWTRYLDNRLNERPITPRPRGSFERTARVRFVPKSVSSLRTICMEPTTLQWYQQGFFRRIDSYIKNHNYLKRRISLERQELNRELAFLGSIDGSFSTIDLSAASDCVSWNLVKKWFHQSALREIVWCCRSKRAQLPNGDTVKLNKFAPMGSALCFPIECLVFAAIVEASIQEVGGRPYASEYRVYGDDIIVESQYADAVIRRLQLNGFTPNVDKSYTYTDSPLIYRESCGGEFLNGDDVTPVRLSRSFGGLVVDTRDASTIERLIDLANDCYGHLPTVRLWVIKALSVLPDGLKVPFSADGSSGLFSPEPTNWHITEGRYSKSFQEFVFRAGGSSTKYAAPDPDDEDIRLFEYLRATQHRERLWFPEDLTVVQVSSPGRTKWLSKNYFDLHP